MRILVIETATEACSVALFDGGELLDARHEVLGRGHAERLVPMIAQLPGKGQADSIRVSLGPGSFTGIRIGLAVAQALGIAWQAKVQGYPTLALLAAMARQDGGAHVGDGVTVCTNGGHGEWFVQNFDSSGHPETDPISLSPRAAQTRDNHCVVIGSKAAELAAGRAGLSVLDCLPDARHGLALPSAVLSDTLAPLYGREPDAKPASP